MDEFARKMKLRRGEMVISVDAKFNDVSSEKTWPRIASRPVTAAEWTYERLRAAGTGLRLHAPLVEAKEREREFRLQWRTTSDLRIVARINEKGVLWFASEECGAWSGKMSGEFSGDMAPVADILKWMRVPVFS